MMLSDQFPCVDAYDIDGLTICDLHATGHRWEEAIRTNEVKHLCIQ